MLQVQIITQLRWRANVKKSQEKTVEETHALTEVAASTRGTPLARERQVYSGVVRPAIAINCPDRSHLGPKTQDTGQ